MPGRPIAAIIGWEWHGTKPDADLVFGAWWPPGVSYSDGSPPNVDDMWVWLRSRDWWISAAWSPPASSGRIAVTIQFENRNEQRCWHNFTADTLLECFEQAVRKSDEEEHR